MDSAPVPSSHGSDKAARGARDHQRCYSAKHHADAHKGAKPQEELDGHVLQIVMARSSVTTPSTSSQPDPGNGRSRNAKMNSKTASAHR
jgi:hypothetical protein